MKNAAREALRREIRARGQQPVRISDAAERREDAIAVCAAQSGACKVAPFSAVARGDIADPLANGYVLMSSRAAYVKPCIAHGGIAQAELKSEARS